MPGPGITTSLDSGDPRVQVLADGDGGAHVGVAVQKQGRDVDEREHVAQVGVRERVGHGAQPGGTGIPHHLDDLVDDVARRPTR